MSQLLEAFLLGNAAILGNVCLLPLYPGMIALLAARSGGQRPARWLGAVVLAGVLGVMIALAAVLSAVGRVFADVLPFVLPVAFGLVIVLGVLMVLGRNPLARLGVGDAPVVSSPAGSAFLYGVMLGPMTLPCTGPVILSAFVLGGIGGTGELVEGVTYFVAFGLGFGWPLVALPFLAGPVQQRATRWLARNHRAVDVVSGLLLVGVATLGLYVDFLA